MTPNRLQTYWPQARDFIKKNWSLISETELDLIDGDFDRFLSILVTHYNDYPASEAKARRMLNKLFDQLDLEASPDLR